jgi:dUTP pyrophosphatase
MTEATINILRKEAENVQYSTHSAGLDLVACYSGTPMRIPVSGNITIPTGISLNLLPDQVAFIFPRSGLGIKYGIVLRNGTGVIDADYKGEIMVCLQNNGTADYLIDINERIAQLVITKFERAANVKVVSVERGTGGFGSTG